MKKTISLHDFRDSFRVADRKESFSYEGLEALYEYLIEVEKGCDFEFELDPIAFCCDFAEYENLKAFQEDYGNDYESIEDISDETAVIEFGDGSFIIHQF